MPPPPRIACGYLPSLPLQILRREHPSWRDRPVVVVDGDKASARITFADTRALGLGIVLGMRYGTAQSLVPGLCAGVVDPERIRTLTETLVQELILLTPRVEAVGASDPGVLFLDPTGTNSLYGDVAAWAEAIRAHVVSRQLSLVLVVGFARDRVLALARASRRAGVRILADEAREITLAAALPLAMLGASPGLVHDLGRLGIAHVGDLGRLPPLELAMRFGPEALALHERATARVTRPFAAAREYEPLRIRFEVEPPDDDVERLLFVLKRGLDQLTTELRERGEVLVTAILELGLDHAPARLEILRPARPGLDVAPLLELFRLRLEKHSLEAKIVEIVLRCEPIRAHARQLDLLAEAPARSEEAASRAVARLSALFGAERVLRITMRDAHLPEARLALAPARHVSLPKPALDRPLALVRRMRAVPLALAAAPATGAGSPKRAGSIGSAGAAIGLPAHLGEVVAMHGPYRVSGGWWVREVSRDYHFVETSHGRVLWVYRDARRRRWYLHGEVD